MSIGCRNPNAGINGAPYPGIGNIGVATTGTIREIWGKSNTFMAEVIVGKSK
jgi:hypothetical protein